MARWDFALTIDRTSSRPLVRQIADAISAELRRGRLRPGDRLAGARTLARTLGVHRQTVALAIGELVAEGWLVTKRASGTFVADRLPQLAPPTPVRGEPTRPPSQFAIPLAAAPIPELPRTVEAGTIFMSGTRPDVRLLPADLIGRAYRRALRIRGPALLSYGEPAGLLRLRLQLSEMLSATRGLMVDANSVLVTRGSQMALALVARALLRPGDAVAVEHPGYRPAWEAFKLAGAQILPVPVDDHGLDVEALERMIADRPIRALYVTPHHQFPTTVMLVAPRRAALLQLAARHRFAIVEDDYDHEFHYSGKPVAPLACADSAGVVIYIGTMSKTLAPGIRLGFVAASADLIERLLAYRSVLDLQGDHALEYAIAELLDEGLVQRHVSKMRRIYRARLQALASELRAKLSGFLTFGQPSGGTAIWVRLCDPRTLSPWIDAARRAGVVFDAGDSFTLGDVVPGARLGFASLSENELRNAVSRLALAAEEALSQVTRSRARRGA